MPSIYLRRLEYARGTQSYLRVSHKFWGTLFFFCKKLQFYFAMLDIFRIFAFVNQYDNLWQR